MGGGTGGMSLFTPMPTEGIKRLNQLYRQPTIENLKLMMDIFVFDTSDLTDALFEARLNNMLSRRDHWKTSLRARKLIETVPGFWPTSGGNQSANPDCLGAQRPLCADGCGSASAVRHCRF